MAGGECGDRLCPGCPAGENTGAVLTAIVRRNLEPSLPHDTCLCQSLRCLRTVRLDRENISKLSNLESVKDAHSLYLQENQIKKIANVNVLKNLRFLTLSGNRIEIIENLKCLQKLQFLDLSHNLIQRLDVGELPQNLLILRLNGNPCTKIKDYRHQVLEALPALQELDEKPVGDLDSPNSVNEYEEDGSDSDDSDTSLPYEDSDGLSSVGQDLLQRSHQRRTRALREHEDRLAELSDSIDGQSSLSTQRLLPSNNVQNTSSHDTSFQTEKDNFSKSPQSALLLLNTTSDIQKDDPSVFPVSRKEIAASSIKAGAGRVSAERGSQSGLATPSSKARPSANAQIKLQQTSKVSAGKVTATTKQKERQATAAPSSQKLQTAPTKKTLPATQKPTAPDRSAVSAPGQRQPAPASSRKLQTAPTKRKPANLQNGPSK